MVVCPAALLATAVSEWLPFEKVIVFNESLNGALVTAVPALLPSTLNCTLVVLADTLVETATVPETVAPDVGEVMATVGAVEGLEGFGFLALVLVTPPHATQSSARTRIRHDPRNALLQALDPPVGFVRKLRMFTPAPGDFPSPPRKLQT